MNAATGPAVEALPQPQPPSARKAARPLAAKGTALARALSQTDQAARQRAAVILEVLAGVRKPGEAAQALGISPMRYYLMESRAMRGLVTACAVPRGGRQPAADQEVRHLRKQVARLERDCARYAALARVAQRAVNLSPPSMGGTSGQKARRRKPPVRALKLAARLKLAAPPDGGDKPPGGLPTPAGSRS